MVAALKCTAVPGGLQHQIGGDTSNDQRSISVGVRAGEAPTGWPLAATDKEEKNEEGASVWVQV